MYVEYLGAEYRRLLKRIKQANREANKYCRRNGHIKRTIYINDKWLCPICDKEEVENEN